MFHRFFTYLKSIRVNRSRRIADKAMARVEMHIANSKFGLAFATLRAHRQHIIDYYGQATYEYLFSLVEEKSC